MSGEFRECGNEYFHTCIERAAESEAGRHSVSAALRRVYAALAPVEKGAAWYEACDSGADAPVMALLDNWDKIRTSFEELRRLRDEYRDITSRAIQDSQR